MKPRLWCVGALVFIVRVSSLIPKCPSSDTCQLYTNCKAMGQIPRPGIVNGGTVSMFCSSFATVQHWDVVNYDDTTVRMINSTSQQLNILNVSSSDEGLYRCYNSAMQSSNAGCLFVLAPGKFASTDTNIVGYVGEPLALPTSFLFTEGSGQCECWRPPLIVVLERNSARRYFCFVNGDSESPTVCQGSETFAVSAASPLSDENIINFNLTFKSLTLNDSGTYKYSVEFNNQVEAEINFVVNVLEATSAPTTMTIPSSGPEPGNDSSTSATDGSTASPKLAGSSNVAVGVGVALPLAIALAVVVVLAILVYLRFSKRMGRWKKSEMNGHNSLHDELIVSNLRPALDEKGRPLSFAEPFPEELGGKQNSEIKNI